MSAIIGLALFALVIFAVYSALLFVISVARKRQNNKYGRWMIYSVVAALLMTVAITQI